MIKVASAEFVAGATTLKALPAATFGEVAFGGRSNVGKSSLLNALLQRKNLVRTSRTPGLTRQINFFETRIMEDEGDLTFTMVDLPGYGFAKVSKDEAKKWGPLMDGYLGTRSNLRAMVILIDVRRGVEEEEATLAAFVAARQRKVPCIVAATKLDKISKSARAPAMAPLKAQTKAIGALGPFGVSAETGEGVEALWKAIRKAL
jgi:GTP-binding protein